MVILSLNCYLRPLLRQASSQQRGSEVGGGGGGAHRWCINRSYVPPAPPPPCTDARAPLGTALWGCRGLPMAVVPRRCPPAEGGVK